MLVVCLERVVGTYCSSSYWRVVRSYIFCIFNSLLEYSCKQVIERNFYSTQLFLILLFIRKTALLAHKRAHDLSCSVPCYDVLLSFTHLHLCQIVQYHYHSNILAECFIHIVILFGVGERSVRVVIAHAAVREECSTRRWEYECSFTLYCLRIS